MKVYVVTHVDGQCGEGTVYGAWSSREAAEAIARIACGGTHDDWQTCGFTVTESVIDEILQRDDL